MWPGSPAILAKLGQDAHNLNVATSRRKRLSDREQARVEMRREAHKRKRSNAAYRRWERENIDPLFEQFSPFNEPDDVRSYPAGDEASRPAHGRTDGGEPCRAPSPPA
jgi:hypothetical protein